MQSEESSPAVGGVHTLMRGFQVDAMNAYGATRDALEEFGSRLDAEGGARSARG